MCEGVQLVFPMELAKLGVVIVEVRLSIVMLGVMLGEGLRAIVIHTNTRTRGKRISAVTAITAIARLARTRQRSCRGSWRGSWRGSRLLVVVGLLVLSLVGESSGNQRQERGKVDEVAVWAHDTHTTHDTQAMPRSRSGRLVKPRPNLLRQCNHGVRHLCIDHAVVLTVAVFAIVVAGLLWRVETKKASFVHGRDRIRELGEREACPGCVRAAPRRMAPRRVVVMVVMVVTVVTRSSAVSSRSRSLTVSKVSRK